MRGTFGVFADPDDPQKKQYLADRRAFKDATTAEYIETSVEEHHRDAVRRRIAALR